MAKKQDKNFLFKICELLATIGILGNTLILISVCSLSNLFFRFHTTTLTEACSNELKQHHL